jgi:hypothetical protein
MTKQELIKKWQDEIRAAEVIANKSENQDEYNDIIQVYNWCIKDLEKLNE